MPTFEQARFLPRAVASLLAQTHEDWTLTIVDDGSRDATGAALSALPADPRIRIRRFEENRGLGDALNDALSAGDAPFVAYLPSDDVYYRDHLASLIGRLQSAPDAVLAYSGVRHHYNRYAAGAIDGEPLQLVQVAHRRGAERWTTRATLVTDDLDRMLWNRLRELGAFVGTGEVTCEWVDHPHQRHKTIREPVGGINAYRQRYRVRHPLRFHSTCGNCIDEAAQYAHTTSPVAPRAKDPLRILLVGELAYNADRVLALEAMGHRLYGLWMRNPYWYNSVGPLAFGHVEDLDAERWRDEIERVRPDVIYALLNWQAVPFAHEVLRGRPRGVPFVWHFKEGPFICLEKGSWSELIELYAEADGRIYSSPEMRDWFTTLGIGRDRPTYVLDGDLPSAAWLEGPRSRSLSEETGDIHTVVPGRPIGLHPHTVAELAAERLHVHFYGDFTHGQWRAWIDKARSLAPDHLHLHANVDQRGWVREFSRYDAGWLHGFESRNRGELARADWDDLNYPARMSTLAFAGLPWLLRDNAGSIVATERLARELDVGIFYRDMADLAGQLRDRSRVESLRANAWKVRDRFSFDHHAPALVAFLREAIAGVRR
jgi:glycosyltransferase involved in cell wall biosynthesis